MNIPLCQPFIGDEEKAAVATVISSRRIASGDTVRMLEDALARKFQRKYCVAVSSGTAALYLGLKALNVKRIIIPAITCEAVLQAALSAGAGVIFSDVEPETHNIDLSALKGSELSRADAVIVTHTYGHSADMEQVDSYVKKHNLVLVEDFAQATGGYFRDRILGSFGKIAVTSFYATKSMTTGHGGAIFTDDGEFYEKCTYGRGSRQGRYFRGLIPLNFQMTDIQAAIGLVQLNKLDMMNEMRRRAASKYTGKLSSSTVSILSSKEWARHAFYKYAILLPEGIRKGAFIEAMGGYGIETGKLYDPPLHKTRTATDTNAVRLPVAEHLAARTVSLPMFPGISDRQVNKVCRAIASIIGDLSGKN